MLSITGSNCGGEKWKNCNGVYRLSYKINPLAPKMNVFKHIYDDYYLFRKDSTSGWCLAHTAGSLSTAKCIESNNKINQDGK